VPRLIDVSSIAHDQDAAAAPGYRAIAERAPLTVALAVSRDHRQVVLVHNLLLSGSEAIPCCAWNSSFLSCFESRRRQPGALADNTGLRAGVSQVRSKP
jgi:hypothetical protein